MELIKQRQCSRCNTDTSRKWRRGLHACYELTRRCGQLTVNTRQPCKFPECRKTVNSVRSVCGLHVSWNLQYLPAADNRKKHNQFDGTADNTSWKEPLCLHS